MSQRFKLGLAAALLSLACSSQTKTIIQEHRRVGIITASPNQASQVLWLTQQIFDGGPGSYGDGGPFTYADGGPGQSLDAGYFCDGGQFFNPSSGCYTTTIDGGPLTLDAGPITYDAGPYAYDAGVPLPYCLLDAGCTSLPFDIPQYTKLSNVFTVTTDGGQDAYGNVALSVSNDGTNFTRLTTPTPVQLNQDGGAGQSLISYSLDLAPMDYLQAKIVFQEDGGSGGVLSGAWYEKQ